MVMANISNTTSNGRKTFMMHMERKGRKLNKSVYLIAVLESWTQPDWVPKVSKTSFVRCNRRFRRW